MKRELELQFGGSVVGFSSLTVDTESCLGQGVSIQLSTVNKGHYGFNNFFPCKEVTPILEVLKYILAWG